MRIFIGSSLVAASTAALGCGYCVEDKIAATYDHAVVTRAMAQKHYVAFFHVDGDATPRVLEEAIYAVRAVDAKSVRISPDRLTVSFAFDPGTPLAAVQNRIDRKLGERGVSLMPLRIMEREADLKLVKAR